MYSMAVWFMFFIVPICFAAESSSAAQEDRGEPGVITGMILNENGGSVTNAKVYLQERGRPSAGFLT